ncbi:MAG TPA: cytochrome c family protein [Burkholderiales bacterium]|nr:cytochrome c family protein [Burkholderiales bacterium]
MKTMVQALVVLAMVNASAAYAQDAKRGQKLFDECAACHSPDRDAKDTVGPPLHGVLGRKAGEGADFRYSPAMKRSGITWSADTLNTFISDPQKLVPGNRMPYSGLPDAKDRADLIAYLLATTK